MRGYLTMENEFKDKFFEVCFDAYWKDNVDISSEINIKNILKVCDLDNNTFFENIQSQKIKDELRELTNLAFEKDIFGAPTFVVNNKIFWGQDRLEYALDEYYS